jgi:hypothetical protein
MYPSNIDVSYTDDEEYRQCIRKIFQLPDNNDNINDIDNNTHITPILDNIYNTTQHIQVFQELYMNAAALLISEDISLGLSILFSYDYFAHFHKVLSQYYQAISTGSVQFDETSQEVTTLRKLLSNKTD